jgi:hypothetical protein
MKHSTPKFEEWWEVVEEYFAKELEKNLAQHRVMRESLSTSLSKESSNFCLWQSNKYGGIKLR